MLRKSHHEYEMVDLKNRYLKSLEVTYYGMLKKEYEVQHEDEMKQLLDEKLFQRAVFARAQELMFLQQQEQQKAADEDASAAALQEQQAKLEKAEVL